MLCQKTTVLPIAFAALALGSLGARAASLPTGIWLDDSGRGAVEITQCGSALCGHVVWVKETNDSKGCGMQIIGDAAPAGAGMWDGGWIYSPERKRRYDVELKPLDDGTLRVKGYMGSKFFSKTMVWTRAPADLKRCGSETTASAPAATASLPSVTKESPVPTPAPAAGPAPASAAAALASQPLTATKPSPASPPASAPPAATAKVADAEDAGPFSGNKEIKLADGYVLKASNGKDCQVKTPFITLKFDCPK